MDLIVEWLRTWISDETTLQIVIVAAAGLIFAVFGLGVAYLFFGTVDPVRRRLSNIAGSHVDDPLRDFDIDARDEGSRLAITLDTVLGPVSRYVLPTSEVERSKMLQKLNYAGYKQPNALQNFYALKTALAVGLPLLVYFTVGQFAEVRSEMLLWYALLGSAAGLLVPNMVLDRKVNRRKKALRDGFPDALDLLVVCIESGLGMSQAIQRVGNELEVSHPELAMELLQVNAEVRAGVDRIAALKNLAARTGLPDINGLVSLLVQTLRFGTSIADSLRVYAEEFRDKRMQAAEEQAAKLGTKLIFPLVLFLFPAFFVVSVGPALIKVFAAFSD